MLPTNNPVLYPSFVSSRIPVLSKGFMTCDRTKIGRCASDLSLPLIGWMGWRHEPIDSSHNGNAVHERGDA
jgi:hypothetical protein